jgi:hypothetical protein
VHFSSVRGSGSGADHANKSGGDLAGPLFIFLLSTALILRGSDI